MIAGAVLLFYECRRLLVAQETKSGPLSQTYLPRGVLVVFIVNVQGRSQVWRI
jgi:hypothetical protein